MSRTSGCAAANLSGLGISIEPATLMDLAGDAAGVVEGGKTGKDLPDALPVVPDILALAIAPVSLPASPLAGATTAEPRADAAAQGNLSLTSAPAPFVSSRVAALQLALRKSLASNPLPIAAPQLSIQPAGTDGSAPPVNLPSLPIVTTGGITALSASLTQPIPTHSAPDAPAPRLGASADAQPAKAQPAVAQHDALPVSDGDKTRESSTAAAIAKASPERARNAEPARLRTETRHGGESLQPAANAEQTITIADHRGAPAAISSATGPAQAKAAGETPLDFNSLVDRLTEARKAALPHVVRTALRNDDFGVVNLQFRMESDRLSVSMNSADPDFAPAVHAASAVGTATQTGTGDTTGNQSARQDTSAGAQAQAGAGQSSARNHDQAQSQQTGGRQDGQHIARGSAGDRSANETATPKGTDRRNSIYA